MHLFTHACFVVVTWLVGWCCFDQALRLNVPEGFPSLKQQIVAAWASSSTHDDPGEEEDPLHAVGAGTTARTLHPHHHHRHRNGILDQIWLPVIAHFAMSSFLGEVLRLPPGGLGRAARLQTVADMRCKP